MRRFGPTNLPSERRYTAASRRPQLPYLVVGGTDARYFREITPNVYRFGLAVLKERDLQRAHGTDERVGFEDYFTAIRFYRSLITNMSGGGAVRPPL